MTEHPIPDQITLEEALKLVSFGHVNGRGFWRVRAVNGDVDGNVNGTVHGDVNGNVKGKIKGRSWDFVETPKDKLQRLITESGNQELIDTFNQMEDS